MRLLRPALFLFFLALTLVFAFWASGPLPRRQQELSLRVVEMSAPQAVMQRWTVSLETPSRLRVGDAELIRLHLSPAEPLQSSPSFPALPGDVVLPALAETSALIAEARLDLAGVEVRPSETVSEPLLPGRALTFFWSVRATQPGEYHGVAWLHLRLISPEGERRYALAAPEVRLQVVTLWGLSASAARWLSLLWAVITFFLGFPYLKELLFFLQRRLSTVRG